MKRNEKTAQAETFDPVTRPTHYASRAIEVIDVIECYELNFRLGNCVKYVLRHEAKGAAL